jgi:hypothetical protein
MTLTATKKHELKKIFLEANEAKKIGIDWRLIFTLHAIIETGNIHRSCSRWACETDEHFDEVMSNYDTH